MCYSAKYEVFEQVGTLHNWMESGKGLVSFEDFAFSGIKHLSQHIESLPLSEGLIAVVASVDV